MKYTIKNCPNCIEYIDGIGNDFICNLEKTNCENIPDCLLKRVVELCKKPLNFLSYGIPEQHLDTVVTSAKRYAKAELAQDILNLLEIQELENE